MWLIDGRNVTISSALSVSNLEFCISLPTWVPSPLLPTCLLPHLLRETTETGLAATVPKYVHPSNAGKTRHHAGGGGVGHYFHPLCPASCHGREKERRKERRRGEIQSKIFFPSLGIGLQNLYLIILFDLQFSVALKKKSATQEQCPHLPICTCFTSSSFLFTSSDFLTRNPTALLISPPPTPPFQSGVPYVLGVTSRGVSTGAYGEQNTHTHTKRLPNL